MAVAAVTVKTADGKEFTSPAAIRIDIAYGFPYATVVASAQAADGESYSASMYLAIEQVQGTVYSTPVSTEPLHAGQTQISRGFEALNAKQATEGTFVLARDTVAYALRGNVETTDSLFRASVQGPYTVTCVVPPEMVGKPPSEGILEFDADFKTEFCRPFSALRKPALIP